MDTDSTAHIICVGDEILLGQITNTNASYIARRLAETGITTQRIVTVADHRGDILEALKTASERCGIIIVTGGLGPTKDDITRPAVAEFYEARLEMRRDLLEIMEQRFASRGIEMPKSAKIQAEFPQGAEPIENRHGTAPGIFFQKDNLLLFAIPGVPLEMEGMLEGFIIPKLVESGRGKQPFFRVIRTSGMGESSLSEIIGHWPFDDIRLAYLPKYYGVDLRITLHSSSELNAAEALNEAKRFLYSKIGEYVYGEGEEELTAVIGSILRQNKWKLTTAESCTGGMLSAMIVDEPGASDYFERGFITYSNEAKIGLLKVPAELLKEYGAVSPQTAEAMARGAAKASDADFALAVTGIAGPSGGTTQKPVGLTYIAAAYPGGTEVKEFRFQGDRNMNRKRSARAALNLLLSILKKSADTKL